MTEADAIAVLRDGIWTALLVAGPILAVALAVGVVIAFMQALTQVQEMTLTFVPKIIAILVTAMITLPFMHTFLSEFALRTFDLIATPNAG